MAHGTSHPRTNAENPALYRVFPFGLSGIGYAGLRPGAAGRSSGGSALWQHGWSHGRDLGGSARTARRGLPLWQPDTPSDSSRYRYGGWTSNDSHVFPGGLSAAPFLDAGGLSAAAVQQILLQDHGGLIRVVPAAAADWSGVFQFRTEGGFLVGADFVCGRPRLVEIRSLEGRPCKVANPWTTPWLVREHGTVIAEGSQSQIAFASRPGGVYLIEQSQSPR